MANKQSATSKASEARRVAAELRAKQRAATRRNTILAVIGAAGLVVLFAAAVMFIVRTGEESGPYTVYDNGVLKVPSAADESGGIHIGPGGVVGGTPATGAVSVNVYEDPHCSWCAHFALTASAEIEVLVDQGVVAYYFHIVSAFDYYGPHNYSTRMAAAWATVAEYDPAHFMAFVKVSYQNMDGANAVTNEGINDLARQAGVSEEAIAKISDGEFTRWVAAASERAVVDVTEKTGQFGTPALFLDGVDFPHWTTEGNIFAGVAYIQENGAAAFAEYLANPPEPAPSPSPSPSL